MAATAATRKPRARRTPPPAEIDSVVDALQTPVEEVAPAPTDSDLNPIPDDFQFTTDTTTPAELTADDAVQFSIDGVELTAYRPSDGAWQILLGGLESSATSGARANALLTFVDHTFAPEAQWYIRERIASRNDSFDVTLLQKVILKLITHWAPATPNRAARRAAARSK